MAGSTAAPNPLAAPAKPAVPGLFGAAKEEGVDAGSKLAKGAAASLSRDAADAYAEVLHFSLQQVGRSDLLAQLPRETVVEALAKELPGFDPETQRELSNARSIWTQTLLGWASSAQADRIEFVTEVLDLAGFGTPGLGGDQAFSTSGGGAGSGDSASSLYLQNLAGAPYEGSDCWGGAHGVSGEGLRGRRGGRVRADLR